jgi:hypothetical protein
MSLSRTFSFSDLSDLTDLAHLPLGPAALLLSMVYCLAPHGSSDVASQLLGSAALWLSMVYCLPPHGASDVASELLGSAALLLSMVHCLPPHDASILAVPLRLLGALPCNARYETCFSSFHLIILFLSRAHYTARPRYRVLWIGGRRADEVGRVKQSVACFEVSPKSGFLMLLFVFVHRLQDFFVRARSPSPSPSHSYRACGLCFYHLLHLSTSRNCPSCYHHSSSLRSL